MELGKINNIIELSCFNHVVFQKLKQEIKNYHTYKYFSFQIFIKKKLDFKIVKHYKEKIFNFFNLSNYLINIKM